LNALYRYYKGPVEYRWRNY